MQISCRFTAEVQVTRCVRRSTVTKLDALDKRIRASDRRGDVLVALPAGVATVTPLAFIASPYIALVANVFLIVPIIIKIIRSW